MNGMRFDELELSTDHRCAVCERPGVTALADWSGDGAERHYCRSCFHAIESADIDAERVR